MFQLQYFLKSMINVHDCMYSLRAHTQHNHTHIYVYVHLFSPLHTHTLTHSHTETHTHTHTCTHSHSLVHTHTDTCTHTVKVRSTLCGYVVLRRVNDSQNNVLKTVELLFERKWVRELCLHTAYMYICYTCIQYMHIVKAGSGGGGAYTCTLWGIHNVQFVHVHVCKNFTCVSLLDCYQRRCMCEGSMVL